MKNAIKTSCITCSHQQMYVYPKKEKGGKIVTPRKIIELQYTKRTFTPRKMMTFHSTHDTRHNIEPRKDA